MFDRIPVRSTLRFASACLLAVAVVAGARLLAQDSKQGGRKPANTKAATESLATTQASPLDEPIRLAQRAREKFRTIQDYTCLFIKRERINGQLLPEEYVNMKSRTRPFSIYLKWQRPYDGREAIYVEGQQDGKLMVHSTGVEKVVGGTVALNPRGEMAMENSRHDVTEAGIGNLIEQLVTRWDAERKLGQTQVEIKENAAVDGRPCILVKTTHPNDPRRYAYYRSRVFIDKEHGLPIRFEGYDWPRRGSPPDGDKVEEYTYRDLKFNVSLTSVDFSVENPKYNFGRL
jgi:outer membrane lipoprotein-sorting protein